MTTICKDCGVKDKGVHHCEESPVQKRLDIIIKEIHALTKCRPTTMMVRIDRLSDDIKAGRK